MEQEIIQQRVKKLIENCNKYEKSLIKEFETQIFGLFDPLQRIQTIYEKVFQSSSSTQQLFEAFEELLDKTELTYNMIQPEIQKVLELFGSTLQTQIETLQQFQKDFKLRQSNSVECIYDFNNIHTSSFTGHKKQSITCLQWDNYLKQLIASSIDGSISVWKGSTLVQKMLEHSSWVRVIRVAQIGNVSILASGGDDSKVNIWQRNHKQSLYQFINKIEFKELNSYVRSLEIATIQDNPVIIFGKGKNDNYSITIHNLKEQIHKFTLHSNIPTILKVISSDNQLQLLSCDNDGLNIIWSINEQKTFVQTIWREKKNNYFTCCDTFQKMIAFGTQRGKFKLFYLKGNNIICIMKLKQFQNPVQGIQFLDNQQICIMSEFKTVNIIDIFRKSVLSLKLQVLVNPLKALIISNNDSLIAIGDNQGFLHLFKYQKKYYTPN